LKYLLRTIHLKPLILIRFRCGFFCSTRLYV
jgi:hypothetical protein